MASTPNFNWSTPDNTGLVKDGALDIRTLGNAIDASMAELKGGTTGQVLSKTSNTDMDFTWVAPTTGDITGVTAGTGLTGGGTSGSVTLALDSSAVIPPTIIDAAGDLIIGTAADTAGRLAIGTNGQVLTSNGTTATWSTPAGGGGAIVQVKSYANSTYSTTTSSSYVDTNLTINITPTSASNKVLIIASGAIQGVTTSAYDTGATANIARGSTTLCEIQNYFYKSNEATGWQLVTPVTEVYLDSPATTSSTTYKVQFKKSASSSSAYYTPISITVMEVTP